MKRVLIVGGNFGDVPKESSVMDKLANILNADIENGGSISDLKSYSIIAGYDMAIWGANVDNTVEKFYPKKTVGTVLICTKVLREDRDVGDAVARIFKMNANAVIAIDNRDKPFTFKLIDALGNIWCSTSDLKELANRINDFKNWTRGSVRIGTTYDINLESMVCDTPKLSELTDIVKVVADKVENERGGRYFGNVSTRCAKLFPSSRNEGKIMVSGRSVPKDRLTVDDFVIANKDVDGTVHFFGNNKPSVDTPIQLELYKHLPNINYMIHGHAYIDNLDTTNEYFPCGDMREVDSVLNLLTDHNTHSFTINLKNHGFLIGTNNIKTLSFLANNLVFSYRNIGSENV